MKIFTALRLLVIKAKRHPKTITALLLAFSAYAIGMVAWTEHQEKVGNEAFVTQVHMITRDYDTSQDMALLEGREEICKGFKAKYGIDHPTYQMVADSYYHALGDQADMVKVDAIAQALDTVGCPAGN